MTPEVPRQIGAITADDPRVTAWALGETDELSAELRREIAAAVARDPALAAEIEALRDLDGALSSALSTSPVEALSPEQRAAILTPPRGGLLLSLASHRRRRRLIAGAGALAAAAALFLIARPAADQVARDRGQRAAGSRLALTPTSAPSSDRGSDEGGNNAVEPRAERERRSPSAAEAVREAPLVGRPAPAPDSNPNRRLANDLAARDDRGEAEGRARPQKAKGVRAQGLASRATDFSAAEDTDPAAHMAVTRSQGDLRGARAGRSRRFAGSPSNDAVSGDAPRDELVAHLAPEAAHAPRLDGIGAGRVGPPRIQGLRLSAGKGSLGGLYVLDADSAYLMRDEIDDYLYKITQAEAARGAWLARELALRQAAALPWSFQSTARAPLSTFSIDVDTASFSHARRYLLSRRPVPAHLVRVEEIINALSYSDPPPEGGAPFSLHVEVAEAPWAPSHRLVRLALSAREVPHGDRPPANLVFLIDVSGSMASRSKLPLLKRALTRMVEELRDDDRVAIVTYAGRTKVALRPTLVAERGAILRVLRRLKAHGYTNGGRGLDRAYQLARDHYVVGGINRVILATDGEFNSGMTDQWRLQRSISAKARSGVMLSVLGFGKTGYDDRRLESLADHGDGRYAFIDSLAEAERVLVRELDATLVTVAKDVRVQVELNPERARGYRLIGYDNRAMAAQAFNREGEDAGELGAGESVVAFYEIIPVGVAATPPGVDPLKYQRRPAPAQEPAPASISDELMTVKVRWVPVEGGPSHKLAVPVTDLGADLNHASADFLLSAAAAGFGMKLRASGYPYASQLTWGLIRGLILKSTLSPGLDAERQRLLELVDAAARVYGGP